LGATKNGALGAEAIVVLNPDAVEGIPYLRKMSMQLPSKMRFVSAQILALLENSLGITTAAQSNRMAQLLRSQLEERIDQGRITGLEFSYPTESNGVFALIDLAVAERLRQKVRFYDWDQSRGEVRWMCSFDTTAEDIEGFVDLIEAELQ
jgi:threonine aldolase